MTNSKAVREQLLKQAGLRTAKGVEDMRAQAEKRMRETGWKPNVCFTCKSCWRRSLQSDLNNLQCPFCGSAMYEVQHAE